ncbi:MAG TPA: hypothetical protein VN867_10265 [Candidatus Binataceae bacterium]|nr:hypothetical protein [Candidatus Binataceae bacterium]
MIARFDGSAAADRSEAAQANVRSTQRVQLMTQVLGLDFEDSADRIERKKLPITRGVDPLADFVAHSLMGTAAGSSGQHVTPDRIFQYREKESCLTVQMTSALELAVILSRCHRKEVFLTPDAEISRGLLCRTRNVSHDVGRPTAEL